MKEEIKKIHSILDDLKVQETVSKQIDNYDEANKIREARIKVNEALNILLNL